MSVNKSQIIITGADGFIGSYIVGFLNKNGFNNIIAVDTDKHKFKNLSGFNFSDFIHKDELSDWIYKNHLIVNKIIHLGAISDTTEFDPLILEAYNTNYTKMIWDKCSIYNIPLVYASSAATYGDGNMGYSDDVALIPNLKPLNPYGQSKQNFDIWALSQTKHPPQWYGLKFFNVYGPFEFHKGKMASVVLHAYRQIRQMGKMKLFKSYKEGIPHGYQKRDFIYVDDVAKVINWLFEAKPKSTIYNVGTGKARTFLDLVKATYNSMNIEPDIEFIEMPEELKERYQYFTEADISKLKNAGYNLPFKSLEEGIAEYVNFLNNNNV